MDGYIKIFRQIKDWEHFQEPSVLLLFIDLLVSANFKRGYFHGTPVGKGSLITSYRKLSDETGLSVNTIKVCISKLIKTGEITIKTAKGQFTHIVINQFNKYQGVSIVDTPTDTPTDTLTDTPTDINRRKKRNIRKEEIDSSCENSQPTDQTKPEPPKTLEERQREFYDEVAQYVGKYDREMLRAFYDYWSEPTQNKKNPKMRKDTERTWATGGRLATWYRRQNETQNNVNTLNSNNYAKNRLKEPHVGQFTDEQFDAICEMGRIITEQNAINKE